MQIIAWYDRGTRERLNLGSLFNWNRTNVTNVKTLDNSKDLNTVSTIPSPKMLEVENSLGFNSDMKLNLVNNQKETPGMDVNKCPIKFTLGELQSHKVDRASLVLFPSSFLLFMTFYWNYYSR